MTTTKTVPSLLVLAMAMAISRPAAAQDATFAAPQPRAEQAIGKAQAARESLTKVQTETGQALTTVQENILTKANAQLDRANRYYEEGHFRDAAKAAELAARLVAKAATAHVHVHDKGVK